MRARVKFSFFPKSVRCDFSLAFGVIEKRSNLIHTGLMSISRRIHSWFRNWNLTIIDWATSKNWRNWNRFFSIFFLVWLKTRVRWLAFIWVMLKMCALLAAIYRMKVIGLGEYQVWYRNDLSNFFLNLRNLIFAISLSIVDQFRRNKMHFTCFFKINPNKLLKLPLKLVLNG